MPRKKGDKNTLKQSYFDEYKGIKVKTKLIFEGHKEYKPIQFSTSKDVYKTFKKLVESDKERFYSLLLNTKNTVIGVDMVSQGPLDTAPVHPREVYKPAILTSAASIIFIHSHPSGDPEPSDSDRTITKQLKEVGDLMGIQVLDHIIIGDEKYYSFADKGDLDSY